MTLATLCLGGNSSALGQASPLKLLIGPIGIKDREAPLTLALSELGRHVGKDYVLYGAEIRTDEHGEPLVSLELDPGSTLEDGLRQIVRQHPEYSYKVESAHLINVYPVDAVRDPQDVLNLVIPRFNVDAVPAGLLVTWPERFIPELKDRLTVKVPGQQQIDLYVGAVATGPTVTIRLRRSRFARS
jgi:hypothetical protein